MHQVRVSKCRVKVREECVVRNKAINLALGVLPDGSRDILGLWIENTEGAKFWMSLGCLRAASTIRLHQSNNKNNSTHHKKNFYEGRSGTQPVLSDH